ncbi:acyl-CoA N-acyltransferase [Echria macrotheca]|uniref:Acyl-CoA N-acyltransferase n=1 Tax=Echria macrotheca TaxID=438768 RepID=A0AAJ0B372_9PEZI|nr:acyl-CoA N-acyltransferase [Echria macrotheca]
MAPYPALDTAWQSTRLVFRTVENDDEDKATLTAINCGDPFGMAMNNPMILSPGSKESGNILMAFTKDAYLRVFICLRSEDEKDDDDDKTEQTNGSGHKTEKNDNDEDKKKKTKTKPKAIGTLFLWPMHALMAHHRNATLGIALARDHRGKGYGPEAINWVLDWAFLRLGLHRVQLGCFSFNDRALRCYRKLGFVEEGRDREAVLFERGWHDVVRFALLEHEWEKMRGYAD